MRANTAGWTVAVVVFGLGWGAQACSGSSDVAGFAADVDAGAADADAGSPGPSCKAGARECVDDRVGRLCPPDGTGWMPFDCRAGETCDKGSCVVATTAKPCAAGATECIGDKLVRTCASDGSAWVPSACSETQSCVAGVCKTTATTKCTPGTALCSEGTAFRCKADGSGYATTTCAMGTTCEAGWCKGSVCNVGSSSCDGASVVSTCVDGSAYAKKMCLANESCVATGAGTAECKTNLCQPGASSCGNKRDATADPTKWVSTCSATTEGYDWVTTQCEGVLSCRSGFPGFSCGADCVPGQTMCTGTPFSFSALATCGADGKWGTPVSCSSLQKCGYIPGTGKSACADAGCEQGQEGVCTADGVKKCIDGKLATTATPCEAGVCYLGSCAPACATGDTMCDLTADGKMGLATCSGGTWTKPTTGCATGTQCTPTGPSKRAVCSDLQCLYSGYGCSSDGKVRPCVDGKLVPESEAVPCVNGGLCVGNYCQAPECATGESICASPSSYRTCIGGRWSAAITMCPASEAGPALACTSGYVGNVRTATCGECSPGSQMCEPYQWPTTSATRHRRCTAGGTWGPYETCAVGVCGYSGTCEAQCVPGTTTCAGQQIFSQELGRYVTLASTTCSSTGVLQPATPCAIGTYCRTNSQQQSLGCLQCVGGRNENGYVDQKCASSTSLATCTSGNTWGTAVACPGGASCINTGPWSSTPAYCNTIVYDSGVPFYDAPPETQPPPWDTMPAYDSKPDWGTCAGCAQNVCTGPYVQCKPDVTCTKYLDCAFACGQDWACVKQCAVAYPGSVTEPLYQCMASSCYGTGGCF